MGVGSERGDADRRTPRASRFPFFASSSALRDADEQDAGAGGGTGRYVTRRECAIGNRSVSLHGGSSDPRLLITKSRVVHARPFLFTHEQVK